MKLYVGCSGWSYSAWLGHFYPKGLEARKFLEYYSKIVDYVEIDSTFYGNIEQSITRKWAKITPDNFKFTAKVDGDVTHARRLGESSVSHLKYFYESIMPLKGKMAAVLLQLPPSLTKAEGFRKLKTLPLDTRFRHAIEARHESWFDDEVYDYLKENNLCLAWSQLAEIQTPPVVTTDFIYLRLIGDRKIPVSAFGKIQKDRVSQMKYWANEVMKLRSNNTLKSGFVAANNHYAGFGPGTANIFLRLIGEQERFWYETLEGKQPTLFDFASKHEN